MYVFTRVKSCCCKHNYLTHLNNEVKLDKLSVGKKIDDTEEK